MAGETSRRASAFGPQWLRGQLRRLLPAFPDVALCVAFSGGADSTALLAALAALAQPPLRLRTVHIDHGLQSSSRAWSRHCARLARALGVSLTVRRARIRPPRGASLEAAAREARYGLLAELLQPGEVLLTAHHQDDQLETVLLQLLRGAGIAGLAAMPACAPFARGLLLRPLLPLHHEQLVAWVRRRGLPWVDDDSNADLSRDRNYLRTQVLPLLQARWPAAAASVARAARHAAEAQQLLGALGSADAARASSGAQLSVVALRALSPERRRNALRAWISAAGCRVPPAVRLAEIAGPMLAARSDARPQVSWQDAHVERSGNLLTLRAAGLGLGEGAGAPPETRWDWQDTPRCPLPPACGTLELLPDAHGPLDLDALPASLTVAARRGGERLRPRRGGPRRALKALLQEARVPPARRAQLPLLFAGTQLLAVADLWCDQSVQAQDASPRRGRLRWRPSA